MIWYWTFEHDGVWTINSDETCSGRPLNDPDIKAWLAEGNTPEEWTGN